jgi:hypothetical protein
MGRRKAAACVVKLSCGASYQGSTPNVCSKEFLQEKFNEAVLGAHPTTLYANTTVYQVDRIKSLFEE